MRQIARIKRGIINLSLRYKIKRSFSTCNKDVLPNIISDCPVDGDALRRVNSYVNARLGADVKACEENSHKSRSAALTPDKTNSKSFSRSVQGYYGRIRRSLTQTYAVSGIRKNLPDEALDNPQSGRQSEQSKKEFLPLDANLNSSFNLGASAPPSSKQQSPIRTNDAIENAPFPTNIRFLAGDNCPHCAEQGFDMTARQARINAEMDVKIPDGFITLQPFHSFSQSSCEFRYSFSIFLHEPSQRSNDDIHIVPMSFADSPPALPCGSRIRIRLNDHLRGEEGVRGWLLIIEARTMECLFEAVNTIDRITPEWKIWAEGAFNRV
ncbi:unnamed protein product [Calicophoron daubneyi]|uniref:Uncharacterized protein n=1 Tax=Calicophoron daubneyi TaxID=300641 RepID=A0AAV2TIJ3_CALDB